MCGHAIASNACRRLFSSTSRSGMVTGSVVVDLDRGSWNREPFLALAAADGVRVPSAMATALSRSWAIRQAISTRWLFMIVNASPPE
jgi:hypothetical protein